MLRRLVGGTSGWGSVSSAETSAIDNLITNYRQLLLDGGRAEVGSEAGYSACAIFLSAVESVAKVIGLEAAARHYRKTFSANYRALFPDDARHYRVDVLEASADQHSAIWVNGDKFELSPEAICHAEALQKAWADLTAVLDSCTLSSEGGKHPARSELASILEDMDRAWAGFEHKYIAELIEIEEQARRLIIKAVDNETKLGQLEDKRGSPEFMQVQSALVQCVAHLNSVANFRRKGRDDLGVEILDSAVAILDRFGLTSRDVVAAGEGKGFAQAALTRVVEKCAGASLAIDVIGSFEAMRRYLREVKRCLERVDPHLCNNSGLVVRLVDWEESWEVGARYVHQQMLHDATNDIVAECKAVGQTAPAFMTMCTDCDVELFLVLPRILILCCLAKPDEDRAGLIKSLLPHRFPDVAAGGAPLQLLDEPEMAALVSQFQQVLRQLGSNAWFILVRRAVDGSSNDASAHQVEVQALMRDVERWSLELQRHCAEDWNQCSSVLVQCINGGSQKQHLLAPGPKFQV